MRVVTGTVETAAATKITIIAASASALTALSKARATSASL